MHAKAKPWKDCSFPTVIAINKIVYKIFGAVSKDLYIEINAHFGIESVENLVANRRDRFINRYVLSFPYCDRIKTASLLLSVAGHWSWTDSTKIVVWCQIPSSA